MNQNKNFIQRIKWAGLLALILIVTYPVGIYFNVQKLGAKIKATKLPQVKLNLSKLRFKLPNWSGIKIGSTSN